MAGNSDTACTVNAAVAEEPLLRWCATWGCAARAGERHARHFKNKTLQLVAEARAARYRGEQLAVDK